MLSEEDLFALPVDLEEYRILRLLGQGAMGRVYLAEDRLLERLVAIKFIAALSPSKGARARFFTEGRAIARLSHPNVVTVYRVGEIRRRPFLVSEHIRGQSLDRLDKPLPWQQVLEIGIGLARGLAAAHRSGVLHRDIKPANAMIAEDGAIKLLDFGLAELSPGRPPTGGAAPSEVPLKAPTDTGGATLTLPADASPAPRTPQAREQELRYGSTLRAVPRVPLGGVEALSSALASTPAPTPPGPMGTPLYMAPELWCCEPATPRSDVYAMGVLLYELCAGWAPHHEVSASALALAALKGAPPLEDAAPGIDPRLATVIDRCLACDPQARFEGGEALREALERIGAAPQAGSLPQGNPYRGLLSFEAEHRALFFGRGTEVGAVLDRLRAGRFVLVAGDSGSGKSSLCRAGVLPAMADGGLAGGPPPPTVTVLLGRRPLAALAAALAPLAGAEEGALAAALCEDPWTVGRSLRQRGGAGVLVFIDQLEELCTLAAPDEARAAAEALGALIEPAGGGVRLLATARGDFLARLAALPSLGEAIAGALYLLRPLPPERLREVIVGPAARLGVSFASDPMLDALVETAASADGGLPLLQFALAELWEARDPSRCEIPAAALDAIGGLHGALARHADGVLARMPPAERREAREILLRLVTAEGTRARLAEAELLGSRSAPAARAALEALVRGRLVVAREGEDASAYELAHEALRSGWDTLAGWLSQDAERRALRHRLARAAAEWERLGQAPDALWGARQLAEVAEVDAASLEPAAAAFLSASRRAVRRGRLARAAALLSIPLALGIMAAGVGIGAARDSARRAAYAEVARAALAEARAARDEGGTHRKEAFARFDAQDAKAGAALWRQVLALHSRADQGYARAVQGIELSLQLGGAAAELREALTDALAERAALAELRQDLRLRDELLERLATYDEGGVRRRRLEAPAHVAIDVAPPGARVTLRRFETDEGRRVPGAPRPLGATPLPEALSIDPGSYLLTFEAEGRAPVRLPVLLERGEQRPLTVTLPRAEEVPEGFVYVPAGRFLFGNNDFGEAELDGTGRRFDPQPLHPVETGAYLIARDEVTFGDWLAFLRALPAEERAQRTPSLRSEFQAIELAPAEAGRYRLMLKPSAQPLTALEGEPIRYPGRKLRAVQDWLRMPVSGISYEDALAYAAWLDRSGRVPRARVCTEHEWERAARGADDRLFPGGDRLKPDDANHDATYGREPLGFGLDEVGSHPASDSPFGVRDLAGNVWEWAVSVERDGRPVLRGGSFYQAAFASLSINREPAEPTLRSVRVGVRMCATPAPAGP